MSAGAAPVAAAAGERPVREGWFAVAAVALGIFSLMTSELLPVGLLTPVRSSWEVSEGTAALMVTVPGLVAAVAAPVIAVAAAGLDRRLVLCALTALVGVANLASALAPGFAVLLTARLLIGVGIGGFWAIAGGLALRLVPREQVGRATAVIFGGVSTASVLGVPAGTLLGELFGWRAAFAVVGLLGCAAVLLLALLVPPLPATRTIGMPDLAALLGRNAGVRQGVVLTFLLITGHFAAYTFVRPVLQDVSGVEDGMISALLLAYGVAGVVGNAVAGAWAPRDVRHTLFAITGVLTAALLLLALAGGGQARGSVLLVTWGLAYGGVSVSLQTWMLKAAPEAAEAATSLLVAAFNLSIALGALAGGLAVDGAGTAAALWAGAALVLLTGLAVRLSHPTSLSRGV